MKMQAVIEILVTEEMKNYPYLWCGDKSGGCISRYCESNGFILHGPTLGELVLRANADGSQAFQVTYANQETKRIRVKPKDLYVRYNDVLREHRQKNPNSRTDTRESSISLVESTK